MHQAETEPQAGQGEGARGEGQGARHPERGHPHPAGGSGPLHSDPIGSAPPRAEKIAGRFAPQGTAGTGLGKGSVRCGIAVTVVA
ncbi:hypothetical protein Aab01nite_49450 [Paractinoplanes abujensis]|nr:hypothetical protein Aab01nite_49450 [Actinoplanes abujensis]